MKKPVRATRGAQWLQRLHPPPVGKQSAAPAQKAAVATSRRGIHSGCRHPLPAALGDVGASALQSPVGGVPVRQIGTAVTVITGTEIETAQVRSLVDMLRGQPGVTIIAAGLAGS